MKRQNLIIASAILLLFIVGQSIDMHVQAATTVSSEYAVVASDRPAAYRLSHFSPSQTKNGLLASSLVLGLGVWLLGMQSIALRRTEKLRIARSFEHRRNGSRLPQNISA